MRQSERSLCNDSAAESVASDGSESAHSPSPASNPATALLEALTFYTVSDRQAERDDTASRNTAEGLQRQDSAREVDDGEMMSATLHHAAAYRLPLLRPVDQEGNQEGVSSATEPSSSSRRGARRSQFSEDGTPGQFTPAAYSQIDQHSRLSLRGDSAQSFSDMDRRVIAQYNSQQRNSPEAPSFAVASVSASVSDQNSRPCIRRTSAVESLAAARNLILGNQTASILGANLCDSPRQHVAHVAAAAVSAEVAARVDATAAVAAAEAYPQGSPNGTRGGSGFMWTTSPQQLQTSFPCRQDPSTLQSSPSLSQGLDHDAEERMVAARAAVLADLADRPPAIIDLSFSAAALNALASRGRRCDPPITTHPGVHTRPEAHSRHDLTVLDSPRAAI